ncbi:MFS general substrate transporter [Serendipita vermifera]|nr:MFS general substrate transporter [Serendipita vermifera]
MADHEREPSDIHQKKRTSSDDQDVEARHFDNDPSHGEVVVQNREDLGTGKAMATAKVWGKYSRVVLYVSLGLAAYVYSLDQTTTYFYVSFATSSFATHSLLSSIEVAAQVILAVGKPIIARLADLRSRPFAYLVVVLSYVLGYILLASSHGVSQFAAGRVFQAAGGTGLQLLTQVIVADFTSLRYRGLISSIMSSPFIINAFVSGKVAASITNRDPHNGWRWGYGMFAILIPIALTPVILTLFWGEWKAKKQNIVKTKPLVVEEREGAKGGLGKLLGFAEDVDLFGLLLLGTGWALLLIALTLSAKAKGGWDNPSIIAMIVVGPIIIILFGVYEAKFAKFPIIPAHILKNKAVMAASLIGFFDFISFYLTFLYLYSFIYVTKTPRWSQEDQNYFINTQSVGLTIFGILGAAIMYYTRRYKWLLFTGLCIRCLGVGVMIHSRGAQGTDGEIVFTQILQAFGGGFAAVASQVGAQASVRHKYVAMVTAIVLLITELGGAIGSAIGGAIWTQIMPKNIAKHLPDVDEATRAELFGSIVSIVALPADDPVRLGVVQAYGDTMRILIIVALAMGLVPIFLSLLMPDYHLGDAQNAIDGLDITGRKVEEGQEPDRSVPADAAGRKI